MLAAEKTPQQRLAAAAALTPELTERLSPDQLQVMALAVSSLLKVADCQHVAVGLLLRLLQRARALSVLSQVGQAVAVAGGLPALVGLLQPQSEAGNSSSQEGAEEQQASAGAGHALSCLHLLLVGASAGQQAAQWTQAACLAGLCQQLVPVLRGQLDRGVQACVVELLNQAVRATQGSCISAITGAGGLAALAAVASSAPAGSGAVRAAVSTLAKLCEFRAGLQDLARSRPSVNALFQALRCERLAGSALLALVSCLVFTPPEQRPNLSRQIWTAAAPEAIQKLLAECAYDTPVRRQDGVAVVAALLREAPPGQTALNKAAAEK